MRLLGIDISKWQGDEINWTKLPESVRFVVSKATQGTRTDPQFKVNWKAVKVNGRVRGAYHLIELDQDISEQVEAYLKVVDLEDGDLPPLLDVETKKIDEVLPETAHAGILEWLQLVERRTGLTPILYISPRGVRHLRGHLSGLNAFPLWVVDYQRKPDIPTCEPDLPESFSEWTFWQFTSDGPGKAYGMESNHLDLDLFNGDEQALEIFTGGTVKRLTPDEIVKAAAYNHGRDFDLKDLNVIYVVARVDNPWDTASIIRDIAAWQELKGMTPDGMIGPKTAKKMDLA